MYNKQAIERLIGCLSESGICPEDYSMMVCKDGCSGDMVACWKQALSEESGVE